jgi:hypothetical protein
LMLHLSTNKMGHHFQKEVIIKNSGLPWAAPTKT